MFENSFLGIGNIFFLKYEEAEIWVFNLLELYNDMLDLVMLTQDIQFDCTSVLFNWTPTLCPQFLNKDNFYIYF